MALTENQELCLEMIESVYSDGVDAIAEPTTDEDGNILVDFQDGTKVLHAKIYPDRETNDIEIWMGEKTD